MHFRPHNEFVLILIQFILQHNSFLFDQKIYHQVKGVAMGSPCAPMFANLYLGGWERDVVFSESMAHHTLSIVLWLPYLDDVLIFWKGNEETFASFVQELNVNTWGLYFTSELFEFSNI